MSVFNHGLITRFRANIKTLIIFAKSTVRKEMFKMKAPANFDPDYFALLKEEAERVALIFNTELGNGGLPFSTTLVKSSKFLTETISWDLARHMNSRDIEVLLSFFACPGIYVASYKSKPGLCISVPSANCVNGILRHVSKVRPVRVHK